MKRFISIVLLFCILFTLVNGTAETIFSPYLKPLIQFKPKINFEILSQELTNLDLKYWKPFKIFKEYIDNKELADTFHLDSALILFITKPLKTIEVRLFLPYKKINIIYGIFITEEEYVYIRQGTTIENGNVLFDLSKIHGNTIMFVFSNY